MYKDSLQKGFGQISLHFFVKVKTQVISYWGPERPERWSPSQGFSSETTVKIHAPFAVWYQRHRGNLNWLYVGCHGYNSASLHSIRCIDLAPWFHVIFILELIYNSKSMTTKYGQWKIHYINGGALNFNPSGWKVQNVCKPVIHQTDSKTTESVWHYTPWLNYF